MYNMLFMKDLVELAKDFIPFFVALITFITLYVFISIFIRDNKGLAFNVSMAAVLTVTLYFATILVCDRPRFDYFFDFFDVCYVNLRNFSSKTLNNSGPELVRLISLFRHGEQAWIGFYAYLLTLHKFYDVTVCLYLVQAYLLDFITRVKVVIKKVIYEGRTLVPSRSNREILTLNCVFNC